MHRRSPFCPGACTHFIPIPLQWTLSSRNLLVSTGSLTWVIITSFGSYYCILGVYCITLIQCLVTCIFFFFFKKNKNNNKNKHAERKVFVFGGKGCCVNAAWLRLHNMAAFAQHGGVCTTWRRLHAWGLVNGGIYTTWRLLYNRIRVFTLAQCFLYLEVYSCHESFPVYCLIARGLAFWWWET